MPPTRAPGVGSRPARGAWIETAPAGRYAAVTRTTRRGDLVDGDEAIPIDAALEAYTLGAAIAAGLDRDCGSLVAGKRADFLVLDEDPRAIAAERLLALPVRETWVAGARVPDRS
jgi:hypothetical protein